MGVPRVFAIVKQRRDGPNALGLGQPPTAGGGGRWTGG